MAYAVLVAIIAGYTAGVGGGYLLSKGIILWLSRSCIKPRLVRLLGAVGGLAALVPAFVLTTFLEESLGGGDGELSTQLLGFGSLGVPVGLGLGLALTLAAVTGGGTLVGSVIARLIASSQTPRAAI